MATRNELLEILKSFDTPTLERLVQYQNKLFIPDSESLTRVTFTDMVQRAHDLADIHFPQWTDRSKADFGEFLVELLSLQSWKDFWYINTFAGEGFLQSSKGYVNTCLNALRLGYNPVQTVSSSTEIDLAFSNVPNDITVKEGDIEVRYNGSDLVFTNAESFVINSGSSTKSGILFKSGKNNTSNTKFNGRSIRISAEGVDQSSIIVSVEGVVWSKVNSFAASSANSQHYMVMPSDGNEFEIIFGPINRGMGARPLVNANVSIQYRSDRSSQPNVAIAALTISKNVTGNYLDSATMVSAASGGAKPENIESVRNNASLLFRTYNEEAIKNADDCVVRLEAMSDIYRAVSFTLGKIVYFAVIPKSGVPADSDFMQVLEDRISGEVMMGFSLSPSLTSYIDIAEITLKVFSYNEFDESDIEQQIRDYFSFITDPMAGAGYGVGIDLGQITKEITSSISGVYNITFTTINGVAPQNIVLSKLQIFNKINQDNLHISVIRTQ